MPDTLQSVHAYHKDYMELVEFSSKINFLAMGRTSSFKEKLMKKQEGKCIICEDAITVEQIANGAIHIHHYVPVYKKGAKSDVKNMQLLHSWCHKEVKH